MQSIKHPKRLTVSQFVSPHLRNYYSAIAGFPVCKQIILALNLCDWLNLVCKLDCWF